MNWMISSVTHNMQEDYPHKLCNACCPPRDGYRQERIVQEQGLYSPRDTGFGKICTTIFPARSTPYALAGSCSRSPVGTR